MPLKRPRMPQNRFFLKTSTVCTHNKKNRPEAASRALFGLSRGRDRPNSGSVRCMTPSLSQAPRQRNSHAASSRFGDLKAITQAGLLSPVVFDSLRAAKGCRTDREIFPCPILSPPEKPILGYPRASFPCDPGQVVSPGAVCSGLAGSLGIRPVLGKVPPGALRLGPGPVPRLLSEPWRSSC